MGRKKLNEDELHKTKFIFKGNPRLYFKTDVMVEFKVPKNNPSFPKTLGKPAFPIFSNDRKYFTPAFSLPRLDEFKDEDCIKIHKQKVQESLRQIDESEIMQAKPGAKSLFCGICRAVYEDYKSHLEEAQHVKMLGESKFQKQIVGLCEYYDRCIKQSTESDILKKASTDTKIHDDESVTECFGLEKKLIDCGSELVVNQNQ